MTLEIQSKFLDHKNNLKSSVIRLSWVRASMNNATIVVSSFSKHSLVMGESHIFSLGKHIYVFSDHGPEGHRVMHTTIYSNLLPKNANKNIVKFSITITIIFKKNLCKFCLFRCKPEVLIVSGS
jgi:hypothetical protein